MTPGAPQDGIPARPDEPWTTRYEEMRRQVMASLSTDTHAYGYALLVRRGVVAWMKAWPQSTPAPANGSGACRTADDVVVPSHLRRSAATLLVNMILSTPTEVPHEQRSGEGFPQPSSP
jgi:hypothetical protein